MFKKIEKEIRQKANPQKAKILQGFFKTGKGEYGEGDTFWGITVPETRITVKKYYKEIKLNDVKKLLKSKIHEVRLCAVLMLVEKYKIAKPQEKKKIFNLYLKNTKHINNWDLIDLSAPQIIGEYLYTQKNPQFLIKLAQSKSLWEKRISILATFYFIRQNYFEPTLKIAKILLKDNHDLIHKAVGWMLREVGKKSFKTTENFLNQYAPIMPRTMLRYAIEKFPPKKRQYYLNLKKVI